MSTASKERSTTAWNVGEPGTKVLTWKRCVEQARPRYSTMSSVGREPSVEKPLKSSVEQPFEQLMDATESGVSKGAHRTIVWLQQQPEGNRRLFLKRLFRVANVHAGKESRVSINVAGAAEVLTWFQDFAAFSLIEKELAKRPIGPEHLYLMGLCRTIAQCERQPHHERSVDGVSALIRELAHEFRDSKNKWQHQLIVESIRVLSILSPAKSLESFLLIANSIGDLEVTALLDDALKALAAVKSDTDDARLRATLDSLWKKYCDKDSFRTSLNGAGVCARLIRGFGISGFGASRMLEMAKATPAESTVLYLLSQQHLGFLAPNDRARLYSETLKQLFASRQSMGVRKLLETVSSDQDVDFVDVFRRACT